MQVTVEIPDHIAIRMTTDGGDLSRRALESLALEELRAGRIDEPELCQLLGIGRLAMDEFLKSHGVYEDYTLEDFEKERAALKQ